jgi:hypothetical protein
MEYPIAWKTMNFGTGQTIDSLFDRVQRKGAEMRESVHIGARQQPSRTIPCRTPEFINKTLIRKALFFPKSQAITMKGLTFRLFAALG